MLEDRWCHHRPSPADYYQDLASLSFPSLFASPLQLPPPSLLPRISSPPLAYVSSTSSLFAISRVTPSRSRSVSGLCAPPVPERGVRSGDQARRASTGTKRHRPQPKPWLWLGRRILGVRPSSRSGFRSYSYYPCVSSRVTYTVKSMITRPRR